jgi:hypothetical protein
MLWARQVAGCLREFQHQDLIIEWRGRVIEGNGKVGILLLLFGAKGV